jgi:hypothetical protein
MTVLHSHKSVLAASPYVVPGASPGKDNAAKDLRRQISQTQDKTKKIAHSHHGMLTAGMLRPCTGFDR